MRILSFFLINIMSNEQKKLKLDFHKLDIYMNLTQNIHQTISLKPYDLKFRPNTTLTKYKSIRQIKRRQQETKNRYLDKSQQQKAKKHRQTVQQRIYAHNNLIDIIKVKLIKHHVFDQVKPETQICQPILNKSRKLDEKIEFVNSKSLQLTNLSQPKQFDINIKQLKTHSSNSFDKNIRKQIIIDLKQRPHSVCQIFRKKIKQKDHNNIKHSTQPLKQTVKNALSCFDWETSRQVSGWQVQKHQQQPLFVQKQQKSKVKLRVKKC